MNGHVFGPVPSRRLGRSLGIDLVPHKTCSYDCIYCQLGRTTCKTVERREWVPLDDVLAELDSMLKSEPDYITLSGSGEPTLYVRLGELIDRIKTLTSIPVAVLTNGSLLWQEEVRRQLVDADLVVPSLDAGDEVSFRAINRPHESISFETMVHGLAEFRRIFSGPYWLEVFLIDGFNTTNTTLDRLARCIDGIRPERIQLNTVTRPPAEQYARRVSDDRLSEAAKRFGSSTEIIADSSGAHCHGDGSPGRGDILGMLWRRPCRIDDVANGLGMHRNEVIKHLGILSDDRLIESVVVSGQRYYRPRKNSAIGSKQPGVHDVGAPRLS